MALEYTTQDGGWTNNNGENTYPYKPEGNSKNAHTKRESAVHNAEANDPRNYKQ